ncbi:unnamed protein product [Rotaria magnacalcarata]|uniref:RNA-directed DNA polymerase n=2 Tax=Rotaria magnacalcarata TaxID=392030 RepID=A0A816Y067_9BILA|nr:unnamed protein product [Rotaria magnacalcarata]
MRAMIDTGANRTFISFKAVHSTNSKQFIKKIQRRVFLADGQSSAFVYGEITLHIMLGDIQASIVAFIVKQLCTDCILGMDFINKYKLIINTEDRTISIRNNDKRLLLKLDSNSSRVHSPARLVNNIIIPPKRTISIPVSINSSLQTLLFRPSFKLQQRIPLIMLNSSLTVHNRSSFISLHNPTSYSCSLPRGIILGTTTVPTLSFKKESDIDQSLVNTYIDKLIQHLINPEHQKKVKLVLLQNAKLLDTSKPTIAFTLRPHEIKTLDHPPPTSKPYYSTPLKQEAMYKIIQELLYSGLIRPSYSPYAAPALLVAKHDGNWRMVVDYKKLNNITIKDNHPLPNMEQALQLLGAGYKLFSTLDMKSGFWQIPIAEADKHKTAFITPEGLYEWNVLAQGLKNSPPSFQRVMTDILSSCRQFSLFYIDDIVIYSRSFDDHLNHVTQILSILLNYNFQLNPSKCNLFQHQIDYLSHTISEYAEANKFLGALSWYRKFIPQFATIAAPIHAITNLTKPNKHKFRWNDLQKTAFLQLKQLLVNAPLFLNFPNDNYPVILTTDASKVGIGGTLQQLIDGEIKNLYYHSQVASSTQRRYDPIELEALAIWLCFQRMRSYLLGRSIIIYTDHCPLCNMMNSSVKNRRVDRISILLQEYDIEKIIHIKGQHNCLADYLSRHPIKHHEEIFDEDYGINMLFDGKPLVTVIVPDVESPFLNAVITRSKHKQIAQQQLLSPQPLPIDITTTDSSVTRPTNDEASTSSSCNYFNIDQIKIEQAKDPNIQRKINEIRDKVITSCYIFDDGLLYKLLPMHANSKRKTKVIYLPISMADSLLKAYHGIPLAGHFGVKRTYLKLKNKFWWPGMIQFITNYIKNCLLCQQYNISRIKKPGKLCQIPTPDGPFQLIGIDFCGRFKRTPRENQYVLCITDYFTRWVDAIALPNCSAQTTAQTIFNDYICRYGVPKSILSDQGTHFNNQLMDFMAKLIGYNHTFSTVYHPQSNGMVERFNATFVPQLAKLHDHENNNWDEYLSPVVFAYNTEPRLPIDKPSFTYLFHKPNDYYAQLQKSLNIIHKLAHTTIIQQQAQYKQSYDKNRSDPIYDINDQVLTKIHGSRSKLDPRYSITPRIIIKKQHPIYWVEDQTTQIVHRVHVNDIRPIVFPSA